MKEGHGEEFEKGHKRVVNDKAAGDVAGNDVEGGGHGPVMTKGCSGRATGELKCWEVRAEKRLEGAWLSVTSRS